MLSTDAPAGTITPPRRSGAGRLALALQEVLTATARLRTRRQEAEDAVTFRHEMTGLIRAARAAALAAGYSERDTDLALFAVTALVDESVLQSGHPAFGDWAKRPLGNQMFGRHEGGVHVFAQLEKLLQAPDSEQLADLLEVYQLCLLLGFGGKYGPGSAGELQRLTAQVADKIRRIRGDAGGLSPDWRPPPRAAGEPPRDPWTRGLAVAAAVGALATGALFVGCRLTLGARVADVRAELTSGER
jgi:type VI secretion system protein ImpK